MTDISRRKPELKSGERVDELDRNGYGIIQKADGFCFGMDAVLLSGFVNVKKDALCLDIGTGTGIIPVLLEAKTEGRHFYGVEIQPDAADMASRSVIMNRLEAKIDILTADIRCLNEGRERVFTGDEEKVRALRGTMDAVTSNPPYMKAQHGLGNPDRSRLISRHEICLDLEELCRAASVLLKSGGKFFMVHRPMRLPEIITGLKNAGIEPKRFKFVHSFADKEANMVLIEAVKGGNPGCRVEKPLVIYREQGVYTDEIYDIYGY